MMAQTAAGCLCGCHRTTRMYMDFTSIDKGHDYAYAGKVELLSIQEVLNTVSGHKRGLAIIGDRTLEGSNQSVKLTVS